VTQATTCRQASPRHGNFRSSLLVSLGHGLDQPRALANERPGQGTTHARPAPPPRSRSHNRRPPPLRRITLETAAKPRRTRVAGYVVLLGALSLGVTETIDPVVPGEGVLSLLHFAAEHPVRWTAWSMLLQLTALLLLPGVVALQGLVHGRGAGLTVTGALVFGGGLVGLFAFGASNGELVPIAGGGPVGEEVVAAMERLDTSIVLAAVFILALPGFHFGLPLLLAGLARAGLVPTWVALVGAIGALGAIPASGVKAWESAAFWLAAVALALAALPLIGRPSGARRQLRLPVR
jgi:hypothetical protein